MPAPEVWLLGASAEAATADERKRLYALAEETLAPRTDWVLLYTCHRVEVYGLGEQPALPAPLAAAEGEAAVGHLMRVAAGLESAVVGEDEVLHQVRDALRAARARRQLDGRLQRLFETAIAAGRRSRAGRTGIAAGLAGRAISWLERRADIAERPVLVVGAGQMGSALAHAARRAGARVTIASRDAARARRLGRVYEGGGVDLAEAARLAPGSAAVAVALAGTWLELRPAELPPIADISAPPAVPAEVRSGLNGRFLGIDDLFRGEGPPGRGYVEEAEKVIATKTAEYIAWVDGRR
jgi:glutamyl-tRNA reductase